MVISMCIPTVAVGARYLDFYIDNLLSTAKHPENIRIFISYHGVEELAGINTERVYCGVDVLPHKTGYFVPSSNHSAAIRALSEAADGDVLIFSDYDMAFLRRDWDDHIMKKLEQVDLFGVAYSTHPIRYNHPSVPFADGKDMMKYQGFPNLSFMAMKRETLEKIGHLTHFDEFLTTGGIPFRVINHPSVARDTGLQLGDVQWLDTGYELPHRARKLGLSSEAMPMTLKDDAKIDPILQSEYFSSDGELFLAHYKKGSTKALHNSMDGYFTKFKAAVNAYLDQAGKRAEGLPVPA